MFDLKDFTLVPANDSQDEQHSRAAFVPWSRGRPWEVFWAQKLHESTGDWVVKGARTTWILVKRDDTEGDIYAGCETVRRTGFKRRHGSPDVEPTYVYGIASVVTPVQHHRRGYATHLLRLLHYQLAESATLPPFPAAWGAPPPPLPSAVAQGTPRGVGSILWSDVGSTFYSKCTIGADRPGWIVHGEQVQELVWQLSPSVGQPPSEWEYIYEDELQSISEELSMSVHKDLEAQNTKGKTIFGTDPASPGLLGNLHAIGRYGPQPEWRAAFHKEPVGVRLRSGHSPEKDVIVLFNLHFPSIGPRLLISYIHNLLPPQLPSLLCVLDSLGSKAGLKEGWVWGLESQSDLVKAWQDSPDREVKAGRRAESMGHLLGVASYVPEGEEGALSSGQMFPWC